MNSQCIDDHWYLILTLTFVLAFNLILTLPPDLRLTVIARGQWTCPQGVAEVGTLDILIPGVIGDQLGDTRVGKMYIVGASIAFPFLGPQLQFTPYLTLTRTSALTSTPTEMKAIPKPLI